MSRSGERIILKLSRRGDRFSNVESNLVNATASVKVRIGQNIEKLKTECGWSYDQLAARTGVDKKAILSHVHGKSKPRPSTQKEYAQAFAKELGRQITANDLEL